MFGRMVLVCAAGGYRLEGEVARTLVVDSFAALLASTGGDC